MTTPEPNVTALTYAVLTGSAAVVAPDFAEVWVGVPLTIVLAALFGSLTGLSFMQGMTCGKILGAIGGGLAMGVFLSPIADALLQKHLGLPEGFDRGIAFLLGFAPLLVPIALTWLRGRAGGAR